MLGHIQGLNLFGRPNAGTPGTITPRPPTTTNYDRPGQPMIGNGGPMASGPGVRPTAVSGGMDPAAQQQQAAQNAQRQQLQQMMLQRMFAGQPQMGPQQQQFAAGPRPQAGYAGAARDMQQWDQLNRQNQATQQGGMQNPLMMLMQMMGGFGPRMYG